MTHRLVVDDPSAATEARRTCRSLGERLELGEEVIARAELVATELTGNLARHAKLGELLLRTLSSAAEVGIELLAIDRGPGIQDLALALADGYSSAGSPGIGLGVVRRQSEVFDLYSRVDRGTVLLARVLDRDVWEKETALRRHRLGVVHLCKPGEDACGDAWDVRLDPGRALALVADGLGHGEEAAEAASAAVKIFRSASPSLTPISLLEEIHAALRSTRGAAVSVVDVRPPAGKLYFAGIGNVATALIDPTSARRVNLTTMPGIVGHRIRTPRELTYDWSPQMQLIVSSDGLRGRWDLERYPGLIGHHPALVAATLYRDFNRGNDDLTVLALGIEDS